MIAYDPEGWRDLYVAMAGAAAALTGLLFVAVSINLAEILKQGAMLRRRAVETLGIVVVVVVVSIVILTPGQSSLVLGVELIAVGIVIGFAGLIPRLRSLRSHEGRLVWTVFRLSGWRSPFCRSG